MDDIKPAVVPVGPYAKARYAFMQSSNSNIFAVLAAEIRNLDYGTCFVFEGHEKGARYFYELRSDGQDYVRTPKGPVELPSVVPEQKGTDFKPEPIEFHKVLRQLTYKTDSWSKFFQNFDTPY